jgi:hypothetical protein
MELFLQASRVCFVIAAIAFTAALILFFLFDIRTVFLIRTGRAGQMKEGIHFRVIREMIIVHTDEVIPLEK